MKKIIQLPSQHQINDNVYFQLCYKGKETPMEIQLPCRVIAVHFYDIKVKYDLELQLAGFIHHSFINDREESVFYESSDNTRIYNIDSLFVTKQ